MEMSVATRVASSAPEFYEWSFPGAPVKVHLHLHVVEALKEALPADTTVSPAPQLQGILLGRSPAIGCIEVSDFRPLLSTEPDDLERAIGSLKAGPDEILPIGFYETCNDEHLHLQENTISLARYFLTDPNCVFLAIQPAPAGSASAGFCFLDKGEINGECCFMEFPFDPATLATMQQAKLEMAQPKPAPVLKPPAFAT